MNKTGSLIGIDEALTLNSSQIVENHRQYLNCGLTDLLSMLGLTKKFVRAQGCYVWDSEGKKYVDFLAGYGAISLGHNHPRVIEAVRKADDLPNILQISLGALPGALAKNLANITPGELQRSFFRNSGAEAVEGALKISRAATRRTGISMLKTLFMAKLWGLFR